MGVTEFSFRLMMVFLPGVIAFIIIDNLTSHRETKIHHWIIYSLLLGFLSYFPWGIITEAQHIIYKMNVSMQFVVNLIDPKTSINFYEILIASITAIFW